MVHLTDAQLDAIREIRSVWPGAELLLIGARALGAHIDMSYRSTEDLDLAIAVSLDDLSDRLSSRSGWRRARAMEQRFYGPSGAIVDVLPVAPASVATGKLECHTMSLVGFDLAFDAAKSLIVGDVSLKLPSAPALAFLKLRAWLDRPTERERPGRSRPSPRCLGR
ncbi:MAG: hypothetical protein KF729_06095 [Sandaracinaceae bacterium]|nr:hypothetical protein [Sandaracinaceae bacterium]